MSIGCQQSVDHEARRSSIQCAERRKRGEAAWVLIVIVLTMARPRAGLSLYVDRGGSARPAPAARGSAVGRYNMRCTHDT